MTTPAEARVLVAAPRTGGRSGVERAIDRGLSLFRRPSVQIVSIALVLAALVADHPPADKDLFARVSVGRLVEFTGAPPTDDPFAYSPKLDRWIDHEWLSGVVLYRVSQWGGDLGLLLLALSLMTATVAVVVAAQRTMAQSRGAAFPWLLATLFFTFDTWAQVVRSRAFTFLFMAILYLALVRWRSGDRRWLWATPPLFALWANMHGGFVAGLGLFGVAALVELIRKGKEATPLLLFLLASAAATLVNPYGIDYWVYLVDAVGMERPGVLEWTGPELLSWRVLVGGILIGIFALGSALARPGGSSTSGPPLVAWALLATTVVATLSARRFFHLVLLTLAVFGTDAAATVGRRVRDRLGLWWQAGRRVIGVVIAGSVVAAAGLAVSGAREVAREGLDDGDFPVAAVRWLETQGQGGDLLVHFNYGSYAIWRLFPVYRVSMDGRYEEVYPRSTVDLVYRALDPGDPGHSAALEALAPDYAIVAAAEADHFGRGWRVVHRDARFAVVTPLLTTQTPPRSVRGRWEPGF